MEENIYPHRVNLFLNKNTTYCDFCNTNRSENIIKITEDIGYTYCNDLICKEELQKQYNNNIMDIKELKKEYGNKIVVVRSNGKKEKNWFIYSSAYKDKDQKFYLEVRDNDNKKSKIISLQKLRQYNKGECYTIKEDL